MWGRLLLQIKHPGVIKVLEPLEETNAQMVIVTEPVFGSLHNILTQFSDVPTAPDDRAGASLSPLEVKYGLFHISETLQFLHHEAKLAHCNLNPCAVIITRDGAWKLAGFEFVASIADFGGPASAAVTYEYSSAHPSPWEEFSQVGASQGFVRWCVSLQFCRAGSSANYYYDDSQPQHPFRDWFFARPCICNCPPLMLLPLSVSCLCAQPRLGYTAPELVGGCLASSDVKLSGAADCFSLAALAYQLIKDKQLLPVGSSTGGGYCMPAIACVLVCFLGLQES